MIRSDEPLLLPARPADPAAPGFPLVASLAPLGVALLIWMITGSAFVLVFAVLGPVIAVAGLIDGRRTNRRTRVRSGESHRLALAVLREAIEERREAARQANWRRTPAARSILEDPGGLVHWRPTASPGPSAAVPPRRPLLVSLGSGEGPSGFRLDGAAGPDDEPELRDLAATLSDTPITADPNEGIGIVAAPGLGRAVARGLLIQLACSLSPDETGLNAPGSAAWAWTAELPHTGIRPAGRHIVVRESPAPPGPAEGNGPRLVIALAPRLEDLSVGCETIVRVDGPTRAEVLRSAGQPAGLGFRPELVTVDEATGFARAVRDRAARAGLIERHRPIPDRVALAELEPAGPVDAVGPSRSDRVPGEDRRNDGLSCPIGIGERGVVWLDLVAAGPHAVVGGTTGSGKSELLVTWITAMATAHRPDTVTFLLIDFKGGAAFQPLLLLPHCVGLITDLDGGQASRALVSLAAELRHRERILAAAGRRDIAELLNQPVPGHPLPRLVIVVDEFATMLSAFPDLHALFVDIAARGRSLGVHLILCTQRPTGVVRDALLANCSLRLSLRVNNRADSQAVLGSDAAAALPVTLPGRCLISAGAGELEPCQVASTTAADLGAIIGHGGGGVRPRRPWLDPLPGRVTVRDLTETEADAAGSGNTAAPGKGAAAREGSLLGLLDEPEEQRYRVARYSPRRDGSLVVVGTRGTGKSAILRTLAAQLRSAAQDPGGRGGDAREIRFVRPDLEAVWDALADARSGLDDPTRVERLILLDDVDSVYARWGDEHRTAAFDLLSGLLRDGPAAGLILVLTAQQLPGRLQELPALCQSSLVLRLTDAYAHAAAGGDTAGFDPGLPPGGGRWQGRRIQLLHPDAEAEAERYDTREEPASVLDDPHGRRSLIVVSGSPARTMAVIAAEGADVVDIQGGAIPDPDRLSLTASGPNATGLVLVGDADAWLSRWSLLASLRQRTDIVFVDCSLADYRSISRRRDLPPPLAPGRGRVWVLRPDGTVRRASLARPDGRSRASIAV